MHGEPFGVIDVIAERTHQISTHAAIIVTYRFLRTKPIINDDDNNLLVQPLKGMER